METPAAPTTDRTTRHPQRGVSLPRPALAHRRDIDGLRAVAILLVVGYHADLPGFGGGFIGVDVFFVLSGFLITRLILTEAERSGTVHLGRFWLRRFRRLFPAAATMTAAVVAASMAVEAPLEWRDRTESGFAALTYWSNHLFANEVGSYFSPSVERNPFLHTWSLAVEEQFYVLWPLLFFLLGLLFGSRRLGFRRLDLERIRIAVTAGFVAASFMVSLRLTHDEPGLGFYSALSRAWEFGAGALLAMSAAALTALSPGTRQRLTAVGAAVFVTAMVVIDDTTHYPGTAALLPVIATLAVLAARPADPIVGRTLRSGAARTIGLVSYSWYLWHWPVIVLGTLHLGSNSPPTRALLAGAALLPAALTYRIIENPIRRSARLARSPRTSVLVLLGFGVAALAVMSLARWQADRAHDDPVVATLAEARDDLTQLDGVCTLLDPDALRTHCSSGLVGGGTTVLVVGDSHASHWLPAVDAAAAELGWGRIAAIRVECPSVAFDWSSRQPECADRQRALPGVIEALEPDLVVMSHSVGYVGDEHDGWRRALEQFARTLAGHGIDLLLILDVPRFPEDPLSCAGRRGPSACALDRTEVEAVLGPVHESERAALAAAGHGTVLDPLPLLCGAVSCPLFVDGAVAYADEHHLTGSFATSLGPELSEAMTLAGRG